MLTFPGRKYRCKAQDFATDIPEFKFNIDASERPYSFVCAMRLGWQFALSDTGKVALAVLALFNSGLRETRRVISTMGWMKQRVYLSHSVDRCPHQDRQRPQRGAGTQAAKQPVHRCI